MITHAVYLVPDIDQASDFLGEVLGFKVTLDDISVHGDRFLSMAHPDDALELQVVEADFQLTFAAAKRAAGIVDFIVSTTDMDTFLAHLETHHISLFQAPVDAPYGRTAIFEDPFGNLWDIVERVAG